MTSPLTSLIASGSKLWLDSVDPELVLQSRAEGMTGATSNPIIVATLIASGRFDSLMNELFAQGHDNAAVAWALTDHLVGAAQKVFLPVWQETAGNDGYVSFELDPLLEDTQLAPPHDQRVARYIELGLKWSHEQPNRMIKVPATAAGIAALEELCAAGVSLNVTLVFTARQYILARDAIWRGAQRRDDTSQFKSVYSIFVSRVDVYTEQHLPDLSAAAQGIVGTLNAKRIWQLNEAFWQDKGLELNQEIVFASTGTKRAEDPPDKYVAAFAGSGIQTNPPTTSDAVKALGKSYTSRIEQMPASEVAAEIDEKVQMQALEETLMAQGLSKFAEPQKDLLALVASKRPAVGQK